MHFCDKKEEAKKNGFFFLMWLTICKAVKQLFVQFNGHHKDGRRREQDMVKVYVIYKNYGL